MPLMVCLCGYREFPIGEGGFHGEEEGIEIFQGRTRERNEEA